MNCAFSLLSQWCLEGGRGESQIRRRHLWTDCICLLIMLPLMVLCAWLTAASGKSSGHSSEFSWQAFSLGLLFAVLFSIFIVWLMFSIRYHRQSWKMWRHNNQLITLRDSAGREGMDPAHTFVCEPLDQTVGSFTGTRGSEIPTVLSLPTELELKQVESPRTLIKQYSSPVLSFTMRPNAASDEVTITNGGYPATLDASALARSLSVHSTGVQTMPHALNFAQGFSELPSCQRAGNALHPQGDGLVIT
ncbi:unnamed protein product [Calicophoron daubneyi]|uniref:Uncharacterized protein n=1 Tax=Calicophoron daubneyi TaxID=300641 RepID=A0AAV2TWX7_CALDB